MWGFGKTMAGALGMPTMASDKLNKSGRVFKAMPVRKTNADANIRGEQMGPVKWVGAGFNYSVFLDRNGAVWTCGKGVNGVLGHGDFADATAPTRVLALKGHRVVKVAAGQNHVLALTGWLFHADALPFSHCHLSCRCWQGVCMGS